MDSTRFDELTKALATSTSRRQTLQRILSIFGAGTLAWLVPGRALAATTTTSTTTETTTTTTTSFCASLGTVCLSGFDCCSNLCVLGICVCIPKGSPCVLSELYCSGHCNGLVCA